MTHRYQHAATLLALASLTAIGCHSAHYSAKNLPRELLASPSAGGHQMQLRGMSLAGGASTSVGPADLLEVTVVTGIAGEKVVPLQTRVSDAGTIDVPHLGSIPVVGLEASDVARRVASVAVQRGVYRQPQVNVSVVEQATYRVTVLGAVGEPGVHEIPRTGCDVLAAIASAGGFGEDAGTVVEVLRHDAYGLAASGSAEPIESEAAPTGEGSGVQPVSFEAPIGSTPGATRTESYDLAEVAAGGGRRLALRDRDVVVVRPKKKRFVHVSGLVHSPDQFELSDDQDLRVLDAIAMAGGVSNNVADKVVLVRWPEDQAESVVINVSIASAKRDGVQNLILQSGDLVSVEPTVATTVVDTVNTFFRVSLGLGGNLSLF